MADREVVEDLKSCQSEATIPARDKDVKEAMQLAENGSAFRHRNEYD